MKSRVQIYAEQVRQAQALRHHAGVCPKDLHEAVNISKLTDWFHTVYAQIDRRLEDAHESKNHKLEGELHNFRASLKDYEPRAGMSTEEADASMIALHGSVRDLPVKYAGTFREYVQRVVDEVEKVTRSGVDMSEPKAPEMPTDLGAEMPVSPGLLGGMTPPPATAPEAGPEALSTEMTPEELGLTAEPPPETLATEAPAEELVI